MTSKSRGVPNSPQDVCPLLTGMAIPELTFTSADGGIFELMKAVKEKPAVLVFYRGGW
jgi:peroxiredoxin